MSLGIYDYLTFLVVIILLVGVMVAALFLLGLPGRIARQRRHPHADSVNLMGWIGFLGGLPWIHALIWAIHPSLTVDIRRLPAEEREALRREFGPEPPGNREAPAESSSETDASARGLAEENPPSNPATDLEEQQ